MPQGLAAMMRAKFPGKYDHVPDDQLEAAIVAKYPQYEHLRMKKPDAPKEESALSRFGSGLYDNLVEPAMGAVKSGATMLMNPEKAMSEAASAGGAEVSRLHDLMQHGNEGHSALNWLPVVGPGLARTADKMRAGDYAGAAGDMTGMAALNLGQAGLSRGLEVAAPRLRQSGLNLGKSVWKIRDTAAKLSGASGGGVDLDAGVNAIIKTAAEEGLLAPTQANRVKAFKMKTAAGKDVEKQWLTPPSTRPPITDPARLLASRGVNEAEILTGPAVAKGETMVVSPSKTVQDPTRYSQISHLPDRPGQTSVDFPTGSSSTWPQPGRAPGAGDQMAHVVHHGEGTQGVPPVPGGPGILRRDVPQAIVKGQPWDTVARKDVLRSIDADIKQAQRTAQPTTGLQALRARWEDMPEYIDRPTARGVVKGINERLAPRYHNAIADPVAVSAEKNVNRLISRPTEQGGMTHKGMETANARFAEVKPMALALSHAVKRSGAREILGAPALLKTLLASNLGSGVGGALGGAVGGALGAVASHPIPQGLLAQRLYNAGKVFPGMASKLKGSQGDLVRAAILGLLQEERSTELTKGRR